MLVTDLVRRLHPKDDASSLTLQPSLTRQMPRACRRCMPRILDFGSKKSFFVNHLPQQILPSFFKKVFNLNVLPAWTMKHFHKSDGFCSTVFFAT